MLDKVHFYKELFDPITFGVQIISSDFCYAFLNKQLLSEISKKEEEVFGKKMVDVFPGIDQAPIFKAIEECFSQKKPRKILNEFTLPSGEVAYYNLKLECLATSVIIFSENITSEKNIEVLLEKTNSRLEKEVQQKTEELSLVFSNVKDYALIFLDANGKIKSWNLGAERIKGYKADEIIGKSFEIFYTDKDLARKFPQIILKLAEQKGKFEDQGWRVKKDGTKFFAHIVITAIRNKENKLVGFSKITRDITQQREKELEIAKAHTLLQKSAEKFRTLFENSPDAYFIMDPEKNAQIIDCNLAAQNILKGTKAQIIGLTLEQISPKFQENDHSSQEQLAEKIAEILKNTSSRFEWLIENLNKELLPCDVYISLISYEERKVLLVDFRDMTDRVKLLELLRKEKDTALKIADFKTNFLARMSHEIRTPLNAMIGMSDILSETNLTIPQKKYLQTITTAGNSLLELINDILDISKIEAGEIKITSTEFDLKNLLNECIDMISLSAEKSKTKVCLTEFPAIANSIKGDELRIRQILFNLLGNAAKFTKNGSISVKVEILSEQKLKIEVTDTGIGIAQEKLAFIFESYKQAEETTAKKYGGTGLGLSICKKLVDLMGGAIYAKSKIGKGSIFSVELPLEFGALLPTKSEPKASILNKRDFSKLKILLADDVEINREIISAFLKDTGCTLVLTCDGLEAVEKFKGDNFDLVFMDMSMPIMDGASAVAVIRSLEKEKGLAPTPILALTANAFDKDAKKMLDAGCNEFIAKPVRKATILAKIEEFTRRENILKQSSAKKFDKI